MALVQDSSGEGGGWTNRIGDACARSLGVVAVASIPTALRTSSAGGNLGSAFLVSMSVLLPVVLLVFVVSRSSARGLRQLIGTDPPRKAARAIALWIAVALPAVIPVGAYLKEHTHHRGLGGTAFSVIAFVTLGASAIVAKRTIALARWLVVRGVVREWVLRVAASFFGLAVLALVLVPLAHKAGNDAEASLRVTIVDGAILVMAGLLVSSVDLSEGAQRIARLSGVPTLVIVLVAGLARIEASPALLRAMRAGGGLSVATWSAVEQWTDRNHDRSGSRLDRNDRDKANRSRHAGARQVCGAGAAPGEDGLLVAERPVFRRRRLRGEPRGARVKNGG
jgi:hypothetical protein